MTSGYPLRFHDEINSLSPGHALELRNEGLYSRKSEMGILKFHRSWTNPALADLSLVDRSLGSFLGEKCFLDHFSMSQNNFIWV